MNDTSLLVARTLCNIKNVRKAHFVQPSFVFHILLSSKYRSSERKWYDRVKRLIIEVFFAKCRTFSFLNFAKVQCSTLIDCNQFKVFQFTQSCINIVSQNRIVDEHNVVVDEVELKLKDVYSPWKSDKVWLSSSKNYLNFIFQLTAIISINLQSGENK